MASAASRDTRLYDVCDPYHGEVGHAWTREFEPAFKSGLGATDSLRRAWMESMASLSLDLIR